MLFGALGPPAASPVLAPSHSARDGRLDAGAILPAALLDQRST